jgi:peptide methionine sulfoxide reductase msrA/msrB
MKGLKYIKLVIMFNLIFIQSAYAEKATFAGGCFWCIESVLEKVDGVKSVVCGYMGGKKEDATYKKVSSGSTDHYEVVQVDYDPKKVSYNVLLQAYWDEIDPTQSDGQYVDVGHQYKTVIFYHNQEQKILAEKSKASLAASGKYKKPIVTEIKKSQTFYKAEAYHQDYYKKNPIRYKMYRMGSGRK